MFTTFKDFSKKIVHFRVGTSKQDSQLHSLLVEQICRLESLNYWTSQSAFPIRSFELRGDLGCGRLFEVQTRCSTKGELGLVKLSICWRSTSASSLSSGAIPAVPAGGDFIWPGCLQATLVMTAARGSVEVQCLRPGCAPATANALHF